MTRFPPQSPMDWEPNPDHQGDQQEQPNRSLDVGSHGIHQGVDAGTEGVPHDEGTQQRHTNCPALGRLLSSMWWCRISSYWAIGCGLPSRLNRWK